MSPKGKGKLFAAVIEAFVIEDKYIVVSMIISMIISIVKSLNYLNHNFFVYERIS